MTHRERIRALKEGKRADGPACSLWGHVMNLSDLNARDFARATIDFQNANDFDFVKVMSNPYYMIEDMGLKLRRPLDFLTPTGRDSGRLPIKKSSDWQSISFSDPAKGALAREKEAIARIVDYFQGDVPVLVSAFTPVTWIQYLALPEAQLEDAYQKQGSPLPALEQYLVENEKQVKPALDHFQELNMRYMEDVLAMGADGIFYAIEYADNVWSGDLFEQFVKLYDLQALRSVEGKSFLTLLHACGANNVRFDKISDYPVDAINWYDHAPDNLSLKEAAAVTDKLLVGGLDHLHDLKGADRERIKENLTTHIRQALEDTHGRVIISGGCAWTVEDTYRFGLLRDTLEEVWNDWFCETNSHV